MSCYRIRRHDDWSGACDDFPRLVILNRDILRFVQGEEAEISHILVVQEVSVGDMRVLERWPLETCLLSC